MKTFALLTWMISSVLISELADVTGTWKGMVMDQFEVTYDFKQDGETLTGSTIGPEGNKVEIKNGTVKGEDISFSIDIMGSTLPITGKVKDNVMSLTFSMDGNPVGMELKKAEPQK